MKTYISENNMNRQHKLWPFERAAVLGAGLLIGTTFTAPSPAQDPQGFVATATSNLGDAVAPKSVGFAQRFGVKNVQGLLRLYGRAGIETAGSDAKDLLKDSPDMRPKFAAVGGLAVDVDFLGALREVAALGVKYELPLASGQGRARSNSFGSKQDYEHQQQEQASKIPGELAPFVRLCGFTIELNKDEPMTGPKELVPGGVATSVMVGPVPLLIRANAGVGVDFGVAPFQELATVDGRQTLRQGVETSAGLYLNGWVVAGVGGGCRVASACAGVKGDIRLVENTAGLRLGYGTLDGLLAQLRYKLSPAVLSISAIAYAELRVGWLKIGKTFEQLLFQWSAPSIEATIDA